MTDTQDTIRNAEHALQKLDPVLGKLIALQAPITHKPRTDYFFSLCRSIIGQQVSVAAATSIFARFQEATKLEPATIAAMNDEMLRALGLSRQKASYLRDLAQHFVEDPNVFNHLDKLSDEDVIQELTAIKGIGMWTAQMFLMFTLVRLDIFAPDDVGLQRAMRQLYGWNAVPSKQILLDKAEIWRPYRTVASWHLWHSLDNEPL